MTVTAEKRQVLADAARILYGGWDATSHDQILACFDELAKHHNRSGNTAHPNWIAAMEHTATVFGSIAKLERRKRANSGF
jgi:hypothetical protein